MTPVYLLRTVQTLAGTFPTTSRLVLHSRCGKGVNLSLRSRPGQIVISGLVDGYRIKKERGK